VIRPVIAYVATAIVFVAMDAVWLLTTNAPLYRPRLAPILADQVRAGPAVLFYVVYLAGVVVFTVLPAVRARRWLTAIQLGAAFGFVAYATYDLTNQATLRVWASQITALDLAWGTFVTAAGASAGYWAVRLAKV
jgi:uncharacterized membrane protein